MLLVRDRFPLVMTSRLTPSHLQSVYSFFRRCVRLSVCPSVAAAADRFFLLARAALGRGRTRGSSKIHTRARPGDPPPRRAEPPGRVVDAIIDAEITHSPAIQAELIRCVTSRDPRRSRSWPRCVWRRISRKRLDIEARLQCTTNMKPQNRHVTDDVT